MRHVVSRALVILGLAGMAWLVVFALGKSSEVTAVRQTIAEQKEANATLVEAAYREKRADSLKYAREVAQARSAERKMAARLDGMLTNAGTTVDSANAVLADSMASTMALRYTLSFTVAKLDTVIQEAKVYRVNAEARFAADSANRVFLLSALSSADTVIAAKNLAIDGWRKASQCTILFGIKCPTRTQAFVGGAIVALGVGLAVRQPRRHMGWNHRVIRRVYKGGESFAVHETYYDDIGKVRAITKHADSPYGDTLEELREDILLFQKALDAPVLDYDAIPEAGAKPFGIERDA